MSGRLPHTSLIIPEKEFKPSSPSNFAQFSALITSSLIRFSFLQVFSVLLLFCTSQIQAAQEQVSIQLKWQHGFQFAGYYAAIEQGYYSDLGLDVTLKQIDFTKDNVEQVIAGESEYGVSDSTLVIYHLKGKSVVLLNQFFQHSPLVFLSHRESGIISPYEMEGKSVAFNNNNLGDAALNTLLVNTLGDLTKINQIEYDNSYFQQFIDGKIDVIFAYSTNEPYLLKQQGISVNIINPQNYGIDFYGDNFFTSQKELNKHPERVEKIMQATVKGWQYALDHPDEIIQLIRNKYNPSLSTDHLRYAARTTAQMIVPKLIDLGSIKAHRYRRTAQEYQRLGFTETSKINNNFFYKQPDQNSILLRLTRKEKAWIKAHPQVSVGGDPDWAPFDFVNKQGKNSGLTNDYLNLIAEKTGLKFTVTTDIWSHHLQNIRDKKIDLLSTAYYTEERSEYVNFSTPYFKVLNYFFVRDDLNVKTLEDLNGKRVAIPKGYANAEIIKKHFPKIKIISVNTFGAAIDSVLENRADMLYDNYATLSYIFKQEGINTIIPFKSTREIGKNSIYMATRKGAPELTTIIQKGLDAISIDEKQTIYKKWLGRIPKSEKKSLQLTKKERLWLNKHPTIRLGAESDWAPFEFVNSSGEMQGLTAEIAQLIESRLGIKFEVISQFSWAETLKKMRNHEVDMVGGIVKTPKRQEYLNFTIGYFTPPISIYTRKNSAEITSLSDLNNKTVAIENQYSLHERLAIEYPEINLLPVATTVEALTAVSHGQADAYIGNQGAANWIASKHALTNIKIALTKDSELERKSHRFAVRKDWLLFQGILNKALASISNLEMSSLRQKWMGFNSRVKKLRLSTSEQKWLNEHQAIRFTGDPNWLPYEAFDQQGNYIGIVAEHLKLIEKKLGIKIDIIPSQSWSESVAKVKRGEIDVLSETSDSDLQSHLTFTQPYVSSPVVIVMKNDQDYVENIEQIKHKKIAVIKEYGYIPKIIKKYPSLDPHIVDTIQEGLTAVSTGKVDALLATLAQASYHISELGINNINIVGKTEFTTQLAFGMSKEFAPMAPLFNRALGAISKGEKQRILDSWGKHKYATKTDYTWLATIAGIMSLIIAVFFYWNRKLAKEVRLRKKIEAQTQALIDAIPLQIIITSFHGDILSANPQALTDYKIRKEDIGHLNILSFYNDFNDRHAVMKELTKKGKVEQKIIPFKKTDGTVRSMMMSIMRVNYHNQNALLTIAVDMTERLEMEAAMQEAKENAEAANHAKSEFLANMSHEIRTPMNAIIGFTELLNDQVKDPKLKSFVKTIHSAGNSLLLLINDILDLSKIEAGKMDIEKTATNPHELFTELGNIFMMSIREKGLDLIIDVDPEIPESLMLDAVRLRQVLLNLIGNAVKFTELGHVRLRARTVNEDKIRSKLNLLIDIEDTGIGIPKQQLQSIFNEFQQTDGQSFSKFGGTGLGLPISRRLTELMGGEISVKSKAGGGSTFTVSLNSVAVASVKPKVLSETDDFVTNTVQFAPAVILVVDDIIDNRQLICENFVDTEITIVEAENGQEAVNIAQQQAIDLILMDIRMPVMNGYQAAEEIKQFKNVPIIALTASVMKDDYERVKSENFDSYLRKPVLRTDLFATLARFLDHQIIEQDNQQATKIELSATQQKQLPEVLKKLQQQTEQWQAIQQDNNISDIKKFAGDLVNIAEESNFEPLLVYANQLMEMIDVFDIEGIKGQLTRFSSLLEELQAYDKKAPAT